MTKAIPAALAALALVACAGRGRMSESKPVRVASMGDAPIAPGDCAEARRRAARKPDLEVDRIPSPVSMKPAPLQNVPPGVLRKDGSADVKVDVIIDTLGRAEMKTFRVVSASHPWLASNVKSVIGKWKFTPAQLAGCKVRRVYHFMASTRPRQQRRGQ